MKFATTATLQVINLAPKHYVVILLIIILQCSVYLNSLLFLPPILRPLFFILTFIIIPGSLTALALYQRQVIPLWQIVGFGTGFGVAEALLWGRILLTLGVGPKNLALFLLGTTILKAGWLWRCSFDIRSPKYEWDKRQMLVPLLTLITIWLTLLQVNLTYPAYPIKTLSFDDKWSYLTVIEQFRVSPNHLNLRPDTVIFGTNTRLSWNSWLYFIAMVSHLTDIHPIHLIFHYLRPSLFLITIYGLYLLGYELFGKRWLALAACVLQLLLALGLNYGSGFGAFWTWMRLEEDKYLAFGTFMPFAWVFLLRTLENRRRADLVGLIAVSLTLALIHPMGLLGLLLTGTPVALVEWWLKRRDGLAFGWLCIVLAAMSVFIGITFLDQKLVIATPYVANYIETHGTLPYFTTQTAPTLLFPQARFTLLALIPLGIFALQDRTARFLLLVFAACAAVLCIPIITAFVSRATTKVGMYRYQWLIPYGFIATWLVIKVSDWWGRYIPRFATLAPSYLTAALIILVVVISGWDQWTVAHSPWLLRQDVPQPPVVLSEDLWQGFLQTADIVRNKRAITPVEYGLAAPTLWPEAELLIYNSPIHAPLTWPKIAGVYQSQDVATTWMLLDDLQPQAIYVPHSTNLYGVLSQNPGSLTQTYTNDEVSLFQADVHSMVRKQEAVVFYADQYTLKPGMCALLHWETVNLHDVHLDEQPVQAMGEQQECPTQNAVFRLEGTRADGSTAIREVHLFVSPQYDYTASFAADRYVIQTGMCVMLRWRVEGADSVFFQDRPSVGESSSQECPSQDTLYTLRIKLPNQETILRNIMIYVRSEILN